LTLPALTATPSVQFLAYPAGTWVLGRMDVIRLESIYDSVQLPQNLVTQLFMEDGWAAMRMCPLSRVYTVNICPTGSTGIQRAVACADITP
ncbi:MAG: major capsid protein, partial [Nitrospiraceae bacterium]